MKVKTVFFYILVTTFFNSCHSQSNEDCKRLSYGYIFTYVESESIEGYLYNTVQDKRTNIQAILNYNSFNYDSIKIYQFQKKLQSINEKSDQIIQQIKAFNAKLILQVEKRQIEPLSFQNYYDITESDNYILTNGEFEKIKNQIIKYREEMINQIVHELDKRMFANCLQIEDQDGVSWKEKRLIKRTFVGKLIELEFLIIEIRNFQIMLLSELDLSIGR
jgi:hypothetical protein